MRRYRLVCALIVVTAMAAGLAVAQETNQRRERLRRAAEAAVEVAEGVIEQNANSAVPTVDGRVIILQRTAEQADAETEPQATDSHEVNAGGLVIVEVPDTQSHPTEVAEPTVTPNGAMQWFGKVRGIRTNDEGRPMMGGGYTWFLFKAVGEGSASVNVKYTPNGGGDPVDQTYQLKITAK
jgi:hypothetical protein